MNFGDLFTLHYLKKIKTMNFEKGFDAALQNKSYYSLKTISLEGIKERFDTLIDRHGITIYVRNAIDMYEEIVRPKLEVYEFSRAIRVVYSFKTVQEAKSTSILCDDGLRVIFGSILIRLRCDIHKDVEGLKEGDCLKDEDVERDYTHLYRFTWMTMKEVAESLRFGGDLPFFFVGTEKDKDTDEAIYEDGMTVAEIYDDSKIYIFATIPHCEGQPLM